MRRTIFTVFFSIALHPLPALAYLDPASGSAIISALLGLIVALALAAKTYWYKISALFKRRNPGNRGREGDPSPPRE